MSCLTGLVATTSESQPTEITQLISKRTLSDCDRFGKAIDRPQLAARFQRIRNAFPTPEEIDDSPKTAPSKRVQALAPGYRKPLMGTLAALEIGLCRMRRECPHFADWLARLEACVA